MNCATACDINSRYHPCPRCLTVPSAVPRTCVVISDGEADHSLSWQSSTRCVPLRQHSSSRGFFPPTSAVKRRPTRVSDSSHHRVCVAPHAITVLASFPHRLDPPLPQRRGTRGAAQPATSTHPPHGGATPCALPRSAGGCFARNGRKRDMPCTLEEARWESYPFFHRDRPY